MTSARPLTLDARRASIRSCSRSSSARSSLSLVRPIRSQPIPTDFARSIPFKSRESSAGRAPLCACAVTTLPSLLGRYESSERASFPDKKTLVFISFHIPNSSLSLSLSFFLSLFQKTWVTEVSRSRPRLRIYRRKVRNGNGSRVVRWEAFESGSKIKRESRETTRVSHSASI